MRIKATDTSQTPDFPHTIRAQRLEILDEKGKPVIVLDGTYRAGPTVWFFDQGVHMRERARLRLGKIGFEIVVKTVMDLVASIKVVDDGRIYAFLAPHFEPITEKICLNNLLGTQGQRSTDNLTPRQKRALRRQLMSKL